MIQWVTCDPVTGAVIESLPGLRLTSSLPGYVGRGDKIACSLPIEKRPPRWRLGTDPNRVVLVAHYSDPDQTVLWAGPIIRQQFGSGPTIDLGAESIHDWLSAQQLGTVFGGAYTAVGRDLSLILADMLGPIAEYFNGTIDVTLCGTLLDYSSDDTADKTCADVANTIMGMNGGPEYTLRWVWDANGCLQTLITVAPHIGSVQTAVLLSKNLEWTYTTDYTAGRGATIVTATSTNSGTVRNQATQVATELIAAGYLPREHRFAPDTGDTAAEILDLHAEAKLAAIATGTVSVELSFHPDGPYLIGRDLQLGDVVEADLSNPDMPEVAATLTARLLGWVATADPISGEITKITPVCGEAS